MTGRRAQANLLALVAALVVLTSLVAFSVSMADTALANGDRDATERRIALSLSERLVAGDAEAGLTRRANVFEATAIANVTVADAERLVPGLADASFRVGLGEATLLARGDLRGGTTVRRVVRVATSETETRTRQVDGDTSVELPPGTTAVRVDVSNTPGAAVRAVRLDGRVVLYDPSGLAGEWRIDAPRTGGALTFDIRGDGERVRVRLRIVTEETTDEILVVTVDA